MKRLLVIAILSAAATACVEGNNPVQLIGARPLSATDCGKRSDGIDQYRGSLDFAASKHYYMTFGLYSPLTTEQSTAGTGFIGEEIVFNYESLGVKGSFKEETLPIYFVVGAGADPDESFIAMDLIAAEARTKLESLVPAEPDVMTLLATIKVKGKLASGRSVETNELTYPIELTRGVGCLENQTPRPPVELLCANPGQDGVPYSCQ